MPVWLQWINPTTWTPEWLSAIGSLGTLAIALVLIIKQYKALSSTVQLSEKQDRALVATTKSLNDEMAHRHEDRLRQAEEAEEHRKAQARLVRFLPFQLWLIDEDGPKVWSFLSRSGVQMTAKYTRFVVSNNSDDRVREVKVGVEHANAPRCYVVSFERFAGVDPVTVLPPGESARFYWTEEISPLVVYVEFTDANGARWRLHHRDGLSEVTGQE